MKKIEKILKSPLREFAKKIGLKPIDDDIFFQDDKGRKYYPTKYGFLTGTQYSLRIQTQKIQELQKIIKQNEERINSQKREINRLIGNPIGRKTRRAVLTICESRSLTDNDKIKQIKSIIN